MELLRRRHRRGDAVRDHPARAAGAAAPREPRGGEGQLGERAAVAAAPGRAPRSLGDPQPRLDRGPGSDSSIALVARVRS